MASVDMPSTPDDLLLSSQVFGINDFLHTNGIGAYGRATDANLRGILDAINEAGNKNRSMIALRAQMISSHTPKNPSMGHLHKHVPDLAKYIADGGILSDVERFPKNSIPEEEFPTAPGSDRPKGKMLNESVEHAAPPEPANTEMDANDEMEADCSVDVEISDAV
ncbi:uncharacterized protein yc1106_08924 [Curvularia clavata]|uniref:Uncharacterized protein n=1 Tax=Curvularia clavata TaxID=95742 RepID=A0A9Q8ZH70_CURCL|nr:uncharacterized protein yc1106_08924 [Curvularia clavata]